MKNLLFCFLMALMVPVFGQDLSVDINKKGVYQIYSSPKVVPDKVLIDSLLWVENNLPDYLIIEVYQKGIITRDSDVVAMNYSYKDLWLKRTKEIDYKMAVYCKDIKVIKTVTKTRISSNSAAVEIYFLLFSILIIFCALFYVAKSNYGKDYIHEKGRFGLFMFVPVALNLIVVFVMSCVVGGISLWFLCLTLLSFFVIARNQSEYRWTQKKYLNYQKVNFLLTVLAIGTITLSILPLIILPIIFALIFFLLSRSAFYKIIGLAKYQKYRRDFNYEKYRQYLWDSKFFVQKYFSHKNRR
ncbi:MAG: hypothetical protein WAW11_02705 [Patescibacteria group bacterium]